MVEEASRDPQALFLWSCRSIWEEQSLETKFKSQLCCFWLCDLGQVSFAPSLAFSSY